MDREVNILFDEHGTPTFRSDRESQHFLGVSVSYSKFEEEHIFQQGEDLFGLNNSQPLKNRQLRISRINKIGNLLISLPVTWIIMKLDLSDNNLQRVVNLYEKYGNIMRKNFRGVRERPVAQILYQQIINHSLFKTIQTAIEQYQVDTTFNIFLDNWAFSPTDVRTSLGLGRQSMERRSNEVVQKFFDVTISVNDIVLLDTDSHRKRFIDVISSVTSRGFMLNTDPRYSNDIKMILNDPRNNIIIEDITSDTVRFLTEFMDKTARGQ